MTPILFIDCEFNGFCGDLISMAIVDCNGNEFYEHIAQGFSRVDSWVELNVLPVVGKEAIPFVFFQEKLQQYLNNYSAGFLLIADWPEDLKYFCESVIIGSGKMMDLKRFDLQLDRELNSNNSKIPHNALADARAIRDMWLGGLSNDT